MRWYETQKYPPPGGTFVYGWYSEDDIRILVFRPVDGTASNSGAWYSAVAETDSWTAVKSPAYWSYGYESIA